MKIGFIGLGTMGGSMAYNALDGGNEMVVHDINPASATRHLEAGATWADTPREVAERSEIVFTSLPGPTEVEAVALGEAGIMEGMSAGKVYFDLSTSTPGMIRKIHAEAAARGIEVLDAPVSGGPRGAASRNLAIWVGGDKDVFDRCKPVLDTIGDKAYYVGPSVAAQWLSWSITAPGTYSRRRWPRCSPWASKPGSSRSLCGRQSARAPPGGADPLREWPSICYPASSTRLTSP